MRNLLTIAFILVSSFVLAQPTDPGGGGDPFIPIDGGVGIAIAAGAAYGSKVLFDRRKKNKE